MIFLDTTILVAASYDGHPDHDASRRCLASAIAVGGACSLHSFSEAFAVLTRLPPPFRLPVDDAIRVITRISEGLQAVSLAPFEHLAALRGAADRGLRGAIVFDALLLACARKVEAEQIYTWNLKHFRMVAPDLASRITTP